QPVTLHGQQARSCAAAFSRAAFEHKIPIYAMAILPDHVHFVIGRGEHRIERIAAAWKAAATRRMRSDGTWTDSRTPWARNCWKVFLFNPADVHRAIRYVHENPPRAGLKPQRWRCITTFSA
ncbi:MAG: transposase, partial [Phycisphaeraceae bacterium]